MKVIIAGSRTITDYRDVLIAITLAGKEWDKDLYDGNYEIVSGHCSKGADKWGEEFAEVYNKKLKIFKANWFKYGLKAGYLRNIEMANYADALIAIWDGKSKGTKHMIDIAKKKDLKVYIHKVIK